MYNLIPFFIFFYEYILFNYKLYNKTFKTKPYINLNKYYKNIIYKNFN